MKKQWLSFVCALVYFTRIPLSAAKSMHYDETLMNGSAKYLPIVGCLLGGFSALMFWLSSFILPHLIAVLIGLISMLLLTGAIHEDGFADVCDGFGGGWTKERILEIMKDSNVGVFAVLGLLVLFILKILFLFYLPVNYTLIAFVVAAPLSRSAAVSAMYYYDYARIDTSSKSKSIAVKISWKSLIFIIIIGVLPLLFVGDLYLLVLILPVYFVRYLLLRYFNKWIGGYTGDCLGAIQQITELVIYLCILVYTWNCF